jgi:hypothetical protein
MAYKQNWMPDGRGGAIRISDVNLYYHMKRKEERGEPRRRIFVFGSNKAGRHGKGSANFALRNHGARYGLGWGPQGNSYAIPTKDKYFNVMPLHEINRYVEGFLRYAYSQPHLDFDVVAIGCGLAGYTPEQIAPMFQGASSNVYLPEEFRKVLQCQDGLGFTATPTSTTETSVASSVNPE